MKKQTVINIYNFIRRSNEEPGQFIQDDFDTIKNQIEVLKQYGLPSTYALKHDALIDDQYKHLILENIDTYDEVGVWWEITEELCRRAGVTYRGAESDVFDNRVSCGYSIGYNQTERKALIDAYMKDFKAVFGEYPKTIASWVIDIVTLQYAYEKYGVIGGGLCRDQIGTDGFTLWGGYINGAFYPSKSNEIMPAQTLENQLDMPLFRLLGPDPIYNFESDLRKNVNGVYSLEPVWPTGRDPQWVSWLFNCLTEEDTIGMSYAQVGQENNFLWENIEPGFEMQLKQIKALQEAGKVRIETLAETAAWFKQKYQTTPPATYQASKDWDTTYDLKTMWYSCQNYRVSFLYEKNELSIRDLFVYSEAYPSRYLEGLMVGDESIFDALPVMNAHYWSSESVRAAIKILDQKGKPLEGKAIKFSAENEQVAYATYETHQGNINCVMDPAGMTIQGKVILAIDNLPVLQAVEGNSLKMEHNNFTYQIEILKGTLEVKGQGILIHSDGDIIKIKLNQKEYVKEIFTQHYHTQPLEIDNYVPKYLTAEPNNYKTIIARPPVVTPGDTVRKKGEAHTFTLVKPYEDCQIHYTLDGSEPNQASRVYEAPIKVTQNTVLKAKVYREGLQASKTVESNAYFTHPVLEIESKTQFDQRKLFNHEGIHDLINGKRGSLDYQDGNWLGTLEDLEAICTLAEPQQINKVTLGFLSHHRSGLIYPEYVCLYAGDDKENLKLIEQIDLPKGHTQREVEKTDVVFKLNKPCKYIKIFAKNYIIQPNWACYKGLSGTFMFTDQIIIE